MSYWWLTGCHYWVKMRIYYDSSSIDTMNVRWNDSNDSGGTLKADCKTPSPILLHLAQTKTPHQSCFILLKPRPSPILHLAQTKTPSPILLHLAQTKNSGKMRIYIGWRWVGGSLWNQKCLKFSSKKKST